MCAGHNAHSSQVHCQRARIAKINNNLIRNIYNLLSREIMVIVHASVVKCSAEAIPLLKSVSGGAGLTYPRTELMWQLFRAHFSFARIQIHYRRAIPFANGEPRTQHALSHGPKGHNALSLKCNKIIKPLWHSYAADAPYRYSNWRFHKTACIVCVVRAWEPIYCSLVITQMEFYLRSIRWRMALGQSICSPVGAAQNQMKCAAARFRRKINKFAV